jgi:DNA-binding LacI/PurR family transcriptional regulator
MARSSSKASGVDKPGIRLIASELGISVSTVSRALRAETAHLVNAERRKKILEMADRMRFTPNPGARMLRNGINANLTVIVPLDESLFYSEFYGRFLGGVLHNADARGWDVQIQTLKHKEGIDISETMQMIGMNTSGIIYLGEPLTRHDLERLAKYRRPLVLTKASMPCDFDINSTNIQVVGVDNTGGAYSAVQLLQQLGHKDVGLFLGPSTSRDAHERHIGYKKALDESNSTTQPEWIFEVSSFNFDGGREAMQKLLKCSKLPTAICCASDEIAFGAITELQTAGLKCPEDISVIGFDDGIWATRTRPALTTVRQPLSDMTERAVNTIIEEATTTEHNHTKAADMPAPLVLRQSTKAI